MTSEEMRKAIAERLGWKLYQFNFAMRSWVALREPGFDPRKLDKAAEAFEVGWEACEYLLFAWDNVPNWPEDLNAMHEAEKAAFNGDGDLWAKYLDEELPPIAFPAPTECAPAPARAEAFLRTIGKWRGA